MSQNKFKVHNVKMVTGVNRLKLGCQYLMGRIFQPIWSIDPIYNQCYRWIAISVNWGVRLIMNGLKELIS